MKGSLLLILSLLTGCEVSSKTSACKEGWAEFDCTYDKVHCRQNLPLKGKDKYQGNYGRSSPQNNKKKNNLNKCDGSQKNLCKNFQGSNSKKSQLDFVVDTCPHAFNQATYRNSKTTITCDYPGNIHSGGFFCKQNNCCCEDILSTKLSQKSNETFTLINTSSGFNISISNVSSHDAGVYWCGVKLKENNYTALRKIQLNVTDIIKFTRSVTTGQSFSYWCNYKKCINAASTTIFICKGEDPSICQTLVTTNSINNGRFSIKDEQKNTNITITLRDVRADDAGTYWCGAKSTDNRHSNLFCNRFLMNVVTPTPPTSTQSNTSSAGLGDSLVVTIEFHNQKIQEMDQQHKSERITSMRRSRRISRTQTQEMQRQPFMPLPTFPQTSQTRCVILLYSFQKALTKLRPCSPNPARLSVTMLL
ncbi:uncharacterized protein LOC113155360 isoform X2 [Anabas testudineus]|uniref:uncharacterized protein LOC113155360 isoform X2 n=1 Tax=Anabas testudineus TaxID=64144 RepID=UPI000E4622BE|nr:uncharacterized protein LOC113155360 isoform X2 [Anabas testudineus]